MFWGKQIDKAPDGKPAFGVIGCGSNWRLGKQIDVVDERSVFVTESPCCDGVLIPCCGSNPTFTTWYITFIYKSGTITYLDGATIPVFYRPVVGLDLFTYVYPTDPVLCFPAGTSSFSIGTLTSDGGTSLTMNCSVGGGTSGSVVWNLGLHSFSSNCTSGSFIANGGTNSPAIQTGICSGRSFRISNFQLFTNNLTGPVLFGNGIYDLVISP